MNNSKVEKPNLFGWVFKKVFASNILKFGSCLFRTTLTYLFLFQATRFCVILDYSFFKIILISFLIIFFHSFWFLYFNYTSFFWEEYFGNRIIKQKAKGVTQKRNHMTKYDFSFVLSYNLTETFIFLYNIIIFVAIYLHSFMFLQYFIVLFLFR